MDRDVLVWEMRGIEKGAAGWRQRELSSVARSGLSMTAKESLGACDIEIECSTMWRSEVKKKRGERGVGGGEGGEGGRAHQGEKAGEFGTVRRLEGSPPDGYEKRRRRLKRACR